MYNGKKIPLPKETEERLRQSQLDYEILSFRANRKINSIDEGTIAFKDSKITGDYVNERINLRSQKEKYIYNDNWDIHSVKRLSDGEVFTVGDRIDGVTVENREIKSITINNQKYHDGDGIKLNFSPHAWVWLKNAQKSKSPLFTTHDGVDIYEGDYYYYVYEFKLTGKCKAFNVSYVGKDKNKTYFSTKEKAEQWIEENKPQYSKKEVEDMIALYNEKIAPKIAIKEYFDKIWNEYEKTK